MVHIDQDNRMANYFNFINGLVKKYDSLVSYALSEHVLVRANPL
jgi:L,D-transpeptidase ErfK/SrfK